MTSAAIRHQIRQYARLAGVRTGLIGGHAFRHSHASQQVDLGANVKVVSDILGHRRPSSTSVYVRVALRRLRGVALPCRNESTLLQSPVGRLQGFLLFKRSLGYRYARAEFTLLEFDKFVQKYAAQHRRWLLDQAIVAWLASKPHRKAVSVSMDAAVLRQFCSYLRRRPGRSPVHEPLWPQLPTESTFTPCVLSDGDIKQLLELSATLTRPRFRAPLFRALILLLYCTGVRVGEALRLRLQDGNSSGAAPNNQLRLQR